MKFKMLLTIILFGFINLFSQGKDSITKDSIDGLNVQITFKKIQKNNKKALRITFDKNESKNIDSLDISIPKGDSTTKFILNDSNFNKHLSDTNIFSEPSILVNKLDTLSLKFGKIYILNPNPKPLLTDVEQIVESTPSFYNFFTKYEYNHVIIIFLIFSLLILIVLLIISLSKLHKLQKNYNLLSDAEKIDEHFKKYHFRFNNRDLKGRIDEIYKEYISFIDEIKKKESHSDLLQKQFNQIQKENEKFNSTNQDLNSKLLSSENQVSNNQKFIQNLELNIQTLNSDLEKEKQLQKEIQNISTLLIEKFNNKSFEIQELASQESLDEAKKSYLKALIFMTFQSKSLIKKINESDSKYDSMNTDLLYDKIVKANKIITSNVKYDDVDPLVYITLKLFKDYKINGINDVFFNGDEINVK